MKNSFIFPGQGSQAVGMVKEFYDNFNYTKNFFEIANEVLHRDIKKIMFEGPEDLLKETENTQPSIMLASSVILEVIKTETGKKINELCSFVAGHSLGEYTALYACESASLEDSLKLLDVRGRSFAKAGKVNVGSMLALFGITLEQAEEIVKKARLENEVLQVANDNTIGQVVLSGSINSIKNAIIISQEIGAKKAIELKVSGAFHSELMRPAIEDMEIILNKTNFALPKVELISNFTAKKTGVLDIKQNLLSQITGRVKWRETMLCMENLGSNVFVEVGEGKILSGMVGKTCPNIKVLNVNSIDTLKEFIKFINNAE